MKKAVKRIAWTLVLLCVLLGILFVVSWKSPKYYRVAGLTTAQAIIPFASYQSNHPRPMIVRQQNALIFGAAHTKDPKAPEIKQIEDEWNTFKPTVALVEGRLGFLLPGVMNPVEKLGEGGKVKALASRDRIPLYNWDLSKEDLAKQLQGRFAPEQIAIAQILNPYFGNLRHGRPDSPENFIEEYLKRASYVSLQDSIKTVRDVDRIWKKYFPAIDWRTVSDEQRLPGYLGDMMEHTNDLRNQQLVSVVKELMAKGERVFVICGSSHAYCVAPVFQ
jgi:hypothetical protein